MFQYRQVLARLRRGDSDREIARGKYMGRRQLAALRVVAAREGWLDPATALPEDAAIAAAFGAPRRAASTISTLETHRALIADWVGQGVSGVAIHGALKRNHDYTGSYSSVYRMVVAISGSALPDATMPLLFAPAEAAQVDSAPVRCWWTRPSVLHDAPVLHLNRRLLGIAARPVGVLL